MRLKAMDLSVSRLLILAALSLGIPLQVVSADEECLCSCVTPTLPETEEEIQAFVEETTEMIEEELTVETETLSSTVRKKESAKDERPSAQNLGYFGVSLLCLSGFIIVALDANYIIQMISFLKNKFAPSRGSSRC